ncbi:MAG TPA: hypothetical protein VND95_03320 [Stellaceae bacterium]|nr:hypothetical protein [Stellaceae bacterium]
MAGLFRPISILPVVAGAHSAINASLTQTLGDAAVAATGAVAVAATLAATLAPATVGAGSGAPRTITPIGVGTATLYARQATAGSGLDTLVDPGSTNPPILFEPPAALSGGTLEVWLIASGGANWGGCQVWVSSDGNTYALAGTLYRGARQGLLTAPLASHPDPDTADTLSVDLTQSEGQLLSGTQADADGLVTLCYCDGELVSYQNATLTASYHYNLGYLRRGAYGTAIAAHDVGGTFARFGPNDPSVLKYPYPASYVGRTLSLKLPAFNSFGQALQSLADVTPVSVTLLGAGVATTNNPVIAALAAGTSQDWGIVGTPVIATADFAPITLAAGLDIDLGSPL